jgi:hypothetical protein
MSEIERWVIYDRGPNTGFDWAFRPGVEPRMTKGPGIDVVRASAYEGAVKEARTALREIEQWADVPADFPNHRARLIQIRERASKGLRELGGQ